MAYTSGRCTNVDYCGLAAARQMIEVKVGEPFSCPECASKLRAPSVEETTNRKGVVLAAIAAGLLLTGGGVYLGTLLSRQSAPAGRRPTPVTPAAEPLSTRAGQAAAPQSDDPPRLLPQRVMETELAPAAPLPAILLRLQGSAAGSVLAPRLAAAFLAAQGDVAVETKPGNGPGETIVAGLRAGRPEVITISIQGADAAIAALGRGEADIALTARRIASFEQRDLQALGDMSSAAGEHEIARRALAVIVNPRNPLATLARERLRGLLDGTLTDWAELGTTAAPLHVLVDYDLQAEGLDGILPGRIDLALSVQPVHDVADKVAADRLALGFVDAAEAGAAKILAIEDGETGAVFTPDPASIAAGTYQLTRRLYLYTPPNGGNPFVDRFLAFALSPDGQAVVAQAGLEPVQAALAASAPVEPSGSSSVPQASRGTASTRPVHAPRQAHQTR